MMVYLRKLRGLDGGQGGFTLVEVMIAIVILAVGFLGITAMQVSAMEGNAIGRDNMGALGVARSVVEILRRDSLSWGVVNATGSPMTAPAFLQKAAVDSDEWAIWDLRPEDEQDGPPLLTRDLIVGGLGTKYCVTVNAHPLYDPPYLQSPQTLNQYIVQVRVTWARRESGEFDCSQNNVDSLFNIANVRAVQLETAIVRNQLGY